MIDLWQPFYAPKDIKKDTLVYLPYLLDDEVFGPPDEPQPFEMAYETVDEAYLDCWWLNEDYITADIKELTLVEFITIHLLTIDPPNAQFEINRRQWQANHQNLCPTPEELKQIIKKLQL